MPLTVENAAREMEAANQVGDPQADELVSDLIDNREIDGGNALFRTIGTLRPGQDRSDLPPRLAQFLKDAEAEPPGWTNADVKAAEKFFYVNHYLGTPEKWLLPKDAAAVEKVWNTEREKEWQKSEHGVFMTKQALDYYKKFFPGPSHDAFIAMIRTALTDKYADMAGIPKSPLAAAGKPLAAGHKLVSGIGGGLLGGSAEKATGVNPYKEILGIGSSAFRDMEKAALTQGQDDQPQMHQELDDNR